MANACCTVVPARLVCAVSAFANAPSDAGVKPLVNCERNCTRTSPALLNWTEIAFSSAFSRTVNPGAARRRPQVATISSQGMGAGRALPSSAVARKTISATWPTRKFSAVVCTESR